MTGFELLISCGVSNRFAKHCHSHSLLRNFYMAFLKRWLAHGSGTFCRVVTFDILFNQFSTELDKRMPIGVGNIPF